MDPDTVGCTIRTPALCIADTLKWRLATLFD
jgi:hypothetical protein